MKRLLKFYRYAFAWENYPLLARTIHAAWLVRRLLGKQSSSPHLSSALAVVEKLYLPPQPGWTVSHPEKIARFAGFIVNLPFNWGKCVQQSLISYRLLNGYGIPAKICFGVNRNESVSDGHAWVTTGGETFAETTDPGERFKIVYTSPNPILDEKY
jgi:hypothetical protein